MLEISQSLGLSIKEPQRATLQSIKWSRLVMGAGEYWVIWMLAGEDAQVDKLRETKIFFDAVPTASSETK